MKIMHLAYNHSNTDIRIFQKECRTLAQEGYDVIYITSEKNSIKKINGMYEGVLIKTLPIANGNRIKRILVYLIQIWKAALREQADVYHIHEVWFLPFIPFLKKYGKVIYDSHEDAPRDLFLSRKENIGILSHLFAWLFEKYENHMVKKVDYIITATPFIKKRFSVLTDQVECIRNYPILRDSGGGGKSFEKREKIVCYTGGMARLNGIFNIIKAMQNVHGLLYLAGSLEEKSRKELSMLSGWSKVESFGYISSEEVQKIFRKSRVGLVLYIPVPNVIEALPNKLFEYMEAGLPVVASNYPLWKEIVEKNQCGICVDPENTKEIANAVNYILENPELAEEMGRNGRRSVEKKYNWREEKYKLIEVYRNI